MLGLQGRDILSHLSRWSPVTLLGLALLVCLTVLVVRIIWVFLFNTYLPRALSRRLRDRDPYPPWQMPAIIAWAGLRGTDSMAAALAIPFATASGAPFPYRSLILFLAFCVILATLVLQGLSLPPLIRWLGLPRDESAEREELRARLVAARAALSRLDELAAEGDVSPKLIEQLRSKYEHRLAHLKAQHGGTDDGSSPEHLAPHQRARLELIDAERRAVIGLRNRGEISDETLRQIERDLDLEELRLEA